VDTSTPDVVNAYQTLEKDGRPLVVFSIGLLKAARNTDEVAFVLGHEMATIL
jgi:Zn-dependent protease with chaperone function